MQGTRTKNVALNASIGLICQIIGIFASFFSRTFFIKILGADYLGVSGLFSNILTILSFAELGIGNAIVFSMYKPLAEKNTEKIKSLMLLYKTAYRVVGLFVLIVGLCCIPFLEVIIKSKPKIQENLILIYLLYLINTSLSYFYSYKKSIISADQKNYIVVLYTQIIQIITIVVQIIILYITHKFIVYLILQIFFTFMCNIILSSKADRMYPFLLEKAIKLEEKERKSIFNNVKALIMYKFGSVILNGTDNIIISAMIGVKAVGLASNYLLIINAINSLLGRILDGFTASVGHLNHTADTKSRYAIFNKMFFINTWIYGFVSVGSLILIQDFIEIWIGNEYILDYVTIIALVLHFYVNGVHNTVYTYRTTLGYFVQGKYSPICAAILNIVLSITLCKYTGLCGIFFATSISRFLVISIVDVYLVYSNCFGKNAFIYFIKYFGFMIVYVGLYFVCKYIISYVHIEGILGVIVKTLIITILFNSIMVCFFYKNKNFQELLLAVKQLKR